jgi:hypothetical protein
MRLSGKQESKKARQQESRTILCGQAGMVLSCFSINTKFLEVEKEKLNSKSGKVLFRQVETLN